MAAPPRQWLKIEQAGELTIARFFPANLLDEQVIEAVGEQLAALADVPGRPFIVVDMRAVRHPGSMLWGKLVTLFKLVRARAGSLVLCNVEAHLRELLEKTLRLSHMLPAYATEQEAVQALIVMRAKEGL